MAKGGFPGFGGGNMQNLMKQAKKMQEDMERDMEKTNAELATKTVESSAGGGAISFVVNGKKEFLSVTIKPEVVDPEDIEMLQDLILVAVNEAIRKADEMHNSAMGKITGGLGGLGGLF